MARSQRDRLLQALVGAPLEGFEASMKLSRSGVRTNRFLLGFERAHMPEDRLLRICDELGAPADFRDDIRARLEPASQVLFGFEADTAGIRFKVYLEFWEQIRAEVLAGTNKFDPRVLHVGWKWDPTDPRRRATSTYTCFPQLSHAEIAERVAAIHRERSQEVLDAPSLAFARSVLRAAASRAEDRSLIYVEVTDGDGSRRSFDLNLYKARLRVGDFGDALASLLSQYGVVSDGSREALKSVSQNSFGHLAGGVGRDGEDFTTIYYETRSLPLDLRAP